MTADNIVIAVIGVLATVTGTLILMILGDIRTTIRTMAESLAKITIDIALLQQEQRTLAKALEGVLADINLIDYHGCRFSGRQSPPDQRASHSTVGLPPLTQASQ